MITRSIDRATKGLGRSISEATLHALDQAALDEANGFTRTMGALGNAALSALGNKTAQGKLELNRATQHLWGEFQRFTRGTKPFTYPVIRDFITRTFNPKVADQVDQMLFQQHDPANAAPPASADQPAGPSANPANNRERPPIPPPANPADNREQPPDPNAQPAAAPVAAAPVAAAAPAPAGANTVTQPGATPVAPAATGTATGTATGDTTPATAVGASSLNTADAASAIMNKPIPAIRPGSTAGQLTLAITQAAAAKAPDKTQVMRLVHQLLSTTATQGKASPDFRTAIRNLKSFQDLYGDKVPELRQIDLSNFTETQLRRVAGLTRYLVEHRITSFDEIDRAYIRFFPVLREATPTAGAGAAPAGGGPPAAPPTTTGHATSAAAQPSRVLGKQEVWDIFQWLAGHMLDNGGMSVGEPEWTRGMRGVLGRALGQHNNNYAHGSSESGNHARIDPSHEYVDASALAYNFQHLKDDPVKQDILRLVNGQRMTITDLVYKAHQLKKPISREILKAIYGAH